MKPDWKFVPPIGHLSEPTPNICTTVVNANTGTVNAHFCQFSV